MDWRSRVDAVCLPACLAACLLKHGYACDSAATRAVILVLVHSLSFFAILMYWSSAEENASCRRSR